MSDHHKLLNAFDVVLSWDLPDSAVISFVQTNLISGKYFD